MSTGYDRNCLPWSSTSRIPRGGNEELFLSIRRSHSSSSISQQRSELPFHCPSCQTCRLTLITLFADRCFETLRIHRIPIRFSRSDRPRNHGQLPSLRTHPRVQDNSRRSNSPQTLGWSEPKIPSDPQRSKTKRKEKRCTSSRLSQFL